MSGMLTTHIFTLTLFVPPSPDSLHALSTTHRVLATPPCDDSCWIASLDGECDDGGPGALFFFCDLGTDCTDCAHLRMPSPPLALSPPHPPSPFELPSALDSTVGVRTYGSSLNYVRVTDGTKCESQFGFRSPYV